MIIDIFTHIWPVKYREALLKIQPQMAGGPVGSIQMLYDLDLRFRLMDRYQDLAHVLTLASPALEEIASPEQAAEMASLANEEMAELAGKYPDKFVAAVATLPMNNINAALKEIDRAIKDLKLKGIQLYTPINDKPLDSPEFLPLFEKMAGYDLPIWIHPLRNASYPDYRTEDSSKYLVNTVFGWPFETTVAMTRLVFSGILEKWPNLKFITHHCGGMVPFFEQRIDNLYKKQQQLLGKEYGLSQAPIEYFKKFYNDTALYGSTPGLMCGYAFFGADHILFGTDMPLGDMEGGMKNTDLTIASIERMTISDADKKKILGENAQRLLKIR